MGASIARPAALERLETLVFDGYQTLRPRLWGGSPVAIVDIDETSLALFGQWPWPRDLMGRMLDRLGDLGAAAIVFDIVFAESRPHLAVARHREIARSRGAGGLRPGRRGT